jgi:hypothetical protein
VRAHITEQLGIPHESCAATIARHVKGSVYVRDYFISPDFLRHRREEVTDMSFKLAEQDAESVKLAVRETPLHDLMSFIARHVSSRIFSVYYATVQS